MNNHVESPLGVRMVAGILAPFVTSTAQEELEDRWGVDPNQLFVETLNHVATFRSHPTMSAAVAVWLRNHTIPEQAYIWLESLLHSLPDNIEDAQNGLDLWADTETMGLIRKFPVNVDETTKTVMASALALDALWEKQGKETPVFFNGGRVKGYEMTVKNHSVRTNLEHERIKVVIPLKNNLTVEYVISVHGAEDAYKMLDTEFDVEVESDQDFVSVLKIPYETTNVLIDLPEFKFETTLDLTKEPDKWGLTEMFKPHGVPGLNNLEINQAVQKTIVEMSYTGVKAAAVTAMTLRASSMWIPATPYKQLCVQFSEPFAWRIMYDNISTPLFQGMYYG